MAAIYNGVRVTEEEDGEVDWADCSYRIFVNIEPGEQGEPDTLKTDELERMDIPPEWRDTDRYCASLAHKCNHSFSPNCQFGQFQHPVFGRVPCILTSQQVSAGQELLVYYRYLLSDCPDWYASLWDAL